MAALAEVSSNFAFSISFFSVSSSFVDFGLHFVVCRFYGFSVAFIYKYDDQAVLDSCGYFSSFCFSVCFIVFKNHRVETHGRI